MIACDLGGKEPDGLSIVAGEQVFIIKALMAL
jgi:hypothetical protein